MQRATETKASPPSSPVLSGDEWPTRERILREAALLFAVVGYRGTTTRKIAAAAGIRQPSLFHHFPSKRAVLEELLAYDLDATVAYSRALAGANGSAAVRLYRYIWWDVTCCIESPFDLRGLSAGSILDDPVFGKWRQDKEELHANIAAMIEQGIGAGEFVACDPHVAREVVTALSTETIRLHDVLPESAHDERQHAAASFVVRALMTNPAQLDAVRSEAVDADLTDWPPLGPR
jgi:AcrR family transcriptional regulator